MLKEKIIEAIKGFGYFFGLLIGGKAVVKQIDGSETIVSL